MASPSIDEFMQAARAFRGLAVELKGMQPRTAGERLLALLPVLYGAALKLEEPRGVSDAESPNVERLDLGTSLPFQYYWIVLDPLVTDCDPVTGSGDLFDDVGDIYADLERGFRILENGGKLEDAVWEWAFSFRTHWGQHLTDALRALHEWYQDPERS